METQYEIRLLVNNSAIELSPFPKAFLTGISIAGVLTLKDVDEIKTLEINIDADSTKIVVNGTGMALNLFPNDCIANTINGFISTLKGVDEIKTVQISIKAV